MGKLSPSSRYFWQAILDRLFPGCRQRRQRQRPLSRPRLEGLEDRLAPAFFHVPADMTLANAIQAAAVLARTDGRRSISSELPTKCR